MRCIATSTNVFVNFEDLDGLKGTCQGLTGEIRYDAFLDQVSFNPDENARRTVSYQDRRRDLGDDFTIDLTDDLESLQMVADALKTGNRFRV